MTSHDGEQQRREEEARIRAILGPQAGADPKKKLELDKKVAEAQEKRKTGNFALALFAAIVITVLIAVVRYLMGN